MEYGLVFDDLADIVPGPNWNRLKSHLRYRAARGLPDEPLPRELVEFRARLPDGGTTRLTLHRMPIMLHRTADETSKRARAAWERQALRELRGFVAGLPARASLWNVAALVGRLLELHKSGVRREAELRRRLVDALARRPAALTRDVTRAAEHMFDDVANRRHMERVEGDFLDAFDVEIAAARAERARARSARRDLPSALEAVGRRVGARASPPPKKRTRLRH